MKKILCWVAILLMTIVSGVNAANVTLAWDASCSTNTAGYKLYYGSGLTISTNIRLTYINDCGMAQPTQTNIYHQPYTNFVTVVGRTNNSITVSNLMTGVTYYFSATTYATNGLESDPSSEVSYTVPTTPQSITYVGNRLEWWTNMTYINRQNFYLVAFTNPPPTQFYRSFLVLTNRFGDPSIIDLKSRLEWYTNMVYINKQIFDLRSFTNSSYFFRSFLIITNAPF